MVKNATLAERTRHLSSYFKCKTCTSLNISWFEVFEADSETLSTLEIQDSEIEMVLAVRLSKLIK